MNISFLVPFKITGFQKRFLWFCQKKKKRFLW